MDGLKIIKSGQQRKAYFRGMGTKMCYESYPHTPLVVSQIPTLTQRMAVSAYVGEPSSYIRTVRRATCKAKLIGFFLSNHRPRDRSASNLQGKLINELIGFSFGSSPMNE